MEFVGPDGFVDYNEFFRPETDIALVIGFLSPFNFEIKSGGQGF